MMRNVYSISVNKLEVNRSFGTAIRKEKAKRQWGKSVGMRSRLTRLKTETCGGLSWHAVETGVPYMARHLLTQSATNDVSSILFCCSVSSSVLFCSLFCSVLLYSVGLDKR